MIIPSIDKNEYFDFTLSNGIRVLAISDRLADKAGCALSVGVGSFDEFGSPEGLAHFLEHMLFMGTEEYPGENEYMEFLSQHNGSSNAYTANENTVYYFDVALSSFEESLKIFSSFFKTPLFLKDSVSREVSAVHSEFLCGLSSDHWRISRMIQIFSKDGRFNVGNKDSLQIPKIEEIVKEFWERKYSPEKMCLVLYSNVEKETYKEYLKCFEEIKSIGNLPIENNSLQNLSLPSIFKEEFLNRIISVDPIKDQKTLIISTVVPQEYSFPKTNPYIYISHVFSKEDQDGFVRILKDKDLGFYSDFDLETYREYSLLRITIGLTTLGVDHIEDILGFLVEYFSSFKYSQEEYLRIKDLKALQFYYKEMEDPIDCVETLAETMQYIPVENIFNYSYSLNHWDEDLVRSIVETIKDRSKWLIFLLNKQQAFDQLDTLYNIKYKVI